MREIKFRAWDWEKMITNFLIKSYWGASTYTTEADIEWWGKIIEEETLNNIMQYTWLKDKNWKEIYEGDIVKEWQSLFIIENLREIRNIEENSIRPIVWCMECGWVCIEDSEIIWNIYTKIDTY